MTLIIKRLIRPTCALLLVLGCGRLAEEPAAAPPGDGLPPVELTGVVFEGFRDATLSARVSARQARVDPGAERADLDDVRILFREEVRGVVELEAPRGTIHLYSEDFELSGGVRGWTEDGERFATDALHYERERQRIWSDTPVQLDRHNFVMEADGMEIELADGVRRIRLLGRVRGVMEPKS